MAVQEIGELVDVERLHVGHHGGGTGGGYVVAMIRIADDGVDLVSGANEQRLSQQRDLAMSSNDDDLHALYPTSPLGQAP